MIRARDRFGCQKGITVDIAWSSVIANCCQGVQDDMLRPMVVNPSVTIIRGGKPLRVVD